MSGPVLFDVGEIVSVREGPFASFRGTVKEVDEGRGLLRLAALMYGRTAPVELEFGQVEKL
jgi:transcriptional antiterminator NusG